LSQCLTKSAPLVADASKHLSHILVSLAELVERCLPLVAGLIVGARSLRVKIAPVKGCGGQSVDGLVDGIVSSSVFITQRGEAGAVDVDGGNRGY
jgi:hypothetical protein